MTTVDFRTRFAHDAIDLDVSDFLDAIAPPALDAHGREAGRAVTRLGLVPLTLDVEGEPITFGAIDGELVIDRTRGSDLVVEVDRGTFSDLMQDVVSTFGTQILGRARIREGSSDAFTEWEPVLRCLLDGRPVYEAGSVKNVARDGSPLDLRHAFTIDDDPADMGHFLAQAGFLHIESMFAEAEMAAVVADLDDAVATAEQGDGSSWWARTEDGWFATRILGFNQRSATLRDLLRSDRFATIGRLTGDQWVQRDPDVGDSAEGLTKKIGILEGSADVSWHKDCALGGHSRGCCGLTVGISITGAGRENGELGVVAGSHRANIPHVGVDGLDLPRLALPTRTGDITVHCSCTLHMSRPPVSAGRQVVYSGFGLASRPGDRPDPRSHDEIRRDRAGLSGEARSRRQGTQVGARATSFDLPDAAGS